MLRSSSTRAMVGMANLLPIAEFLRVAPLKWDDPSPYSITLMVKLFAHAVQYAPCPFRRPRFNDLLGNRRHDHSQGARQPYTEIKQKKRVEAALKQNIIERRKTQEALAESERR